jgi:replication initiation and membrane attachment protein DnaB
MEGIDQYQVKISKRFSALENLDDDLDIKRMAETLRQIIQISSKESLPSYELKQHTSRFNETFKTTRLTETSHTAIDYRI